MNNNLIKETWLVAQLVKNGSYKSFWFENLPIAPGPSMYSLLYIKKEKEKSELRTLIHQENDDVNCFILLVPLFASTYVTRLLHKNGPEIIAITHPSNEGPLNIHLLEKKDKK